MVFKGLETKATKTTVRLNPGSHPNDNEKPKEPTIELRQNLGQCPNDENPKETKNRLKSNL